MQRANAVLVALLVVWTAPVVSTALVSDGPGPYDPASVDLSGPPAAVAADVLREAATRDVTAGYWQACDAENRSDRPTEDGLCRAYRVELDREDAQALVHGAGEGYDVYVATCRWVGSAEEGAWRRVDRCSERGDVEGWFLSPGAANLSSLSDVTVVRETGGALVLRVADTEAVYSLWTGRPNTTAGSDQDVRVIRANATLYVDKGSGHLRRLDLARLQADGERRTVERTRLVYEAWDATDVRRPAGISYSVWEALAEARP